MPAVYNPFRYRGYYYDTETQLYYLQSRYYNPAWGRFLNVDAYISTGTGLLGYNMYTYCDNDPIMKVDVSGYRGEEKKYFDYDDPFDLLPECLEGGIGSSYSLYATRSRVAAYDANLLGYYSSGVTSAVRNPRYYIVPGAVTVTDDMVREPTVRVYRSVSGAEAKDIQDTGRFNLSPNGMESKQFGLNINETRKFGEKMGQRIIVSADVPAGMLNRLCSTPVDPFIFKSGTLTVYGDQLDIFNQAVNGTIRIYP